MRTFPSWTPAERLRKSVGFRLPVRIALSVIAIGAFACGATYSPAQEVQIFERIREIPAPGGHLVLAAPNLAAEVLKDVKESATVNASAALETHEGTFYISDWSYQRWRAQHIKPNWIYVRNANAPVLTMSADDGLLESSTNDRTDMAAVYHFPPELPDTFRPVTQTGGQLKCESLALLGESGLLVTATRELRIWSVKSGALLRRIPTRYDVEAIVKLPGSTKIVCVERTYKEGGGIYAYDLVTGGSTELWNSEDHNDILSVAYSPADREIIVGSGNTDPFWLNPFNGRITKTALPKISLASEAGTGAMVKLLTGELVFTTKSRSYVLPISGEGITWASRAECGTFFGKKNGEAFLSKDETFRNIVKLPDFDLDSLPYFLPTDPNGKRIYYESSVNLIQGSGFEHAEPIYFSGRNLYRIGTEKSRLLRFESPAYAWDVDERAGILAVIQENGEITVHACQDLALLQRIGTHPAEIKSFSLSPSGNQLATVDGEGRGIVFDLGSMMTTLLDDRSYEWVDFNTPHNDAVFVPGDFRPGDELMIVDGDSKSVTKMATDSYLEPQIAADCKPIAVTASRSNFAVTFGSETSREASATFVWGANCRPTLIETGESPCVFPAFSKDGKNLFLPGASWSEDYLVDLSGVKAKSYDLVNDLPFWSGSFSSDGTKLALAGLGGSDGAIGALGICSIGKSGPLQLRNIPITISDGAHYAEWRPGFDQVLVGGIRRYGNVQVFHLVDASNGRKLGDYTRQNLNGPTTPPSFSADGRRLAIQRNGENAVDLCNVSTDGEITVVATLVRPSTDPRDWILLTPDGYYMGTPEAAQNVYFVKGLEHYSFDEFDAIRNRPDIVLERLSLHTGETGMFHDLVEYRRRKLGAQSVGSIPEAVVEIQEPALPMVVSDSDSIEIRFSVDPKGRSLNGIRLYNNGVLLEGVAAIPTLEPNAYRAVVPVRAGKNTIQVSASLSGGVESLRQSVIVSATAPTKPRLFLGLVGVGAYAGKIRDLKYPANDVADLERYFSSQLGLAYSRVVSEKLLDAEATKQGIKRLRDFFSQAGPNDVTLLYLAGHGFVNSAGGYEFAPVDGDIVNRSLVGGVTFAELENLFTASKATKRALIMDTCHAGELVDDFQGSSHLSSGDLEFFMQQFFSDLRRGSGISVVAAAGGTELAGEGNLNGTRIENGNFTHCFLKVLRTEADNRPVTLSEILPLVQAEMRSFGIEKQRPLFRANNPLGKFVIAAPSYHGAPTGEDPLTPQVFSTEEEMFEEISAGSPHNE